MQIGPHALTSQDGRPISSQDGWPGEGNWELPGLSHPIYYDPLYLQFWNFSGSLQT